MTETDNDEGVSRTVLVVDDIKTNRFLLVKLLKKFGVNSVEAEDGVEAVEMCQKETYSMVFMDIDMPQMDGIEATQRIRALSNGCEEVPIVAITAGGVRATREICLGSGMNDHYTKPIERDTIRAILDKWYPFEYTE